MDRDTIDPVFEQTGCETLNVTRKRLRSLKTFMVLTLEGDIDTYSAPCLQRSAQDALDAGFIHLVLVLDRVPYLSSKAVGVLMQVQQSARDRGGDMAMTGVQQRVLDVFRLLRLELYFRCAPSLAGAVDCMKGSGG
jgi:anti-sigma B factor antagonist